MPTEVGASTTILRRVAPEVQEDRLTSVRCCQPSAIARTMSESRRDQPERFDAMRELEELWPTVERAFGLIRAKLGLSVTGAHCDLPSRSFPANPGNW